MTVRTKTKDEDLQLSSGQEERKSDKLFLIILAAVILLGSAGGFVLSRNEAYTEAVNEFVETFGKERIETNYISVAEEVLGEEVVTVEKIILAINNNRNMGPRYKDLARKLLNNIVSVEPNFNLRIFYENIQSLVVKVFDDEEEEKYNLYTHYDVKNNMIYMKKGSDDPTVCHELMHTARSLYRITEKNILIVCDKKGNSLNEAVIDSMVGTLYSGYEGSFYERKVLDYLLNDEEIDYEQYSNYGVRYLIDDFKIKYNNVDIDYIVHYFDTKKIRSSRIGDTIRLENNKKICDELFLVCLNNINPYDDDVYHTFEKFLDLLGNYNQITFTHYQNRFNQYLAERGILNTFDGEMIL